MGSRRALDTQREAAARLGVSADALELLRATDVVDLHVDTFIWTRLFGYDLAREHRANPLGARWLSQADLPRLRRAGVGSALWSITTQPLRTRAGRGAAFRDNLARLRQRLGEQPGVEVVRDLAGYRRARAGGLHAAFLCVQGGHALDDVEARAVAGDLVAVTLVHLTSSSVGGTSSPLRRLGRARGLTRHGAELVEWLDAQRMFVDLAHIDREGFMAACDVHDRRLPLAVTHTGVAGVYPHWRNVDDEQLRRVADTGGVVGIMYEPSFLGPAGARGLDAIVSHLEHVARVAGEDAPALGSDWDGAISTPPEMPTCLELPRLVQRMLDRGFGVDRVQRVLGGNYLRALGELRP